MFAPDQYQLLDFGGGRKLERFGCVVLDRPASAAHGAKRALPELWPAADARFELNAEAKSQSQRGEWVCQRQVPESWSIRHDKNSFHLKLTDFGHVGVFPEQAEKWDWIAKACGGSGPERVLNLFAYTGGSTLAAAAAGAEVVHVDAARNVVAWARRNAEASSMASAPVRWIAEDALKFARRELKRGQHYNAVILDPPSYGHGPSGEPWKLESHLHQLLLLCRDLTAPQPRFVLLTCHAPDYDAARLAECLAATGFAYSKTAAQSGNLSLATVDGRHLPAGHFACIENS